MLQFREIEEILLSLPRLSASRQVLEGADGSRHVEPAATRMMSRHKLNG